MDRRRQFLILTLNIGEKNDKNNETLMITITLMIMNEMI